MASEIRFDLAITCSLDRLSIAQRQPDPRLMLYKHNDIFTPIIHRDVPPPEQRLLIDVVWIVSVPDLNAGLRLTLDIEYDQYLGLFSHKAGARLAIHPSNVTAFPEDFGVSAAPGQETEIGISLVNVANKRPIYLTLPLDVLIKDYKCIRHQTPNTNLIHRPNNTNFIPGSNNSSAISLSS